MVRKASELQIKGKKFNRLTAIKLNNVKPVKGTKRTRHYWLFKCNCGNKLVTRKDAVTSGRTKSCGCLHIEVSTKSAAILNKKHGKRQTRIYTIWANMHDRCRRKNNKSWEYYGGAGIKVCKRWYLFDNFYDDMHDSYLKHSKNHGEKNTTIDRIDYNKGYEPSNCRWATRQIQADNTRQTRYLSFQGKTMSLHKWAKYLNINYGTLKSRLNNCGWSVEKSLSTEVKN